MRAVLAIGLAVLLAGCGQSKPDPLPPTCSNGPDEILRALRPAPDRVALSDGTSLSDCVRQAFDDAELQLLGYSFTPAADTLAGRGTPDAAFQLGYLLGAVRKGAGETNGVHLELVRRIEATITFDAPALLAAARHGAAEGERRG